MSKPKSLVALIHADTYRIVEEPLTFQFLFLIIAIGLFKETTSRIR